MAQDAPDWQRVVNVTAGPGMTDAPDWERVVVGPGGGSVGGGYASLTGAGETSTPGDLKQIGGFVVDDSQGHGISLGAAGAGGTVAVLTPASITLTSQNNNVLLDADALLGLTGTDVTIQANGPSPGLILQAPNTTIQIINNALGFFGHTPHIQIAGSSISTLAQLIAALQSYGLLG